MNWSACVSIFWLLMALAISSCKTKQVTVSSATTIKAETKQSNEDSYFAINHEFKTMSIKADARYQDDQQSQNVHADIRISKDEKILISARVLGITMAKALITPTQVQYYDKLNGAYFEGDFSTLSKWLGADLNYQKIQNILLGNTIDDLMSIPYEAEDQDKLIRFNTQNQGFLTSYVFDKSQFFLSKQEINHLATGRRFMASYPSYRGFSSLLLPEGVYIEATQDKGNIELNVTYKQITLNENISFPYSVPEGYERIIID